jgi:hypothetical protein
VVPGGLVAVDEAHPMVLRDSMVRDDTVASLDRSRLVCPLLRYYRYTQEIAYLSLLFQVNHLILHWNRNETLFKEKRDVINAW